MNQKITTKNWKKRVIFHINALKHLNSYKKNFKKTKKFKLLIKKKNKQPRDELYHLEALKHLHSLKSLKNTKKIKKFKTFLINIIINTIVKSRKHKESLQKLNQQIIKIKTKKLI